MAEGAAGGAPQDLNLFVETALPGALAELHKSRENVANIASYCAKAYAQEDPKDINAKTKNYVKDALSNVSYHIHNVGLHIVQFLQMQQREMDNLNLQVTALTQRLRATQVLTGTNSFRTMETPKAHEGKGKNRKLQPGESPANARSKGGDTRRCVLNVEALSSVGISLSGNQGGGNYDEAMQSLTVTSSSGRSGGGSSSGSLRGSSTGSGTLRSNKKSLRGSDVKRGGGGASASSSGASSAASSASSLPAGASAPPPPGPPPPPSGGAAPPAPPPPPGAGAPEPPGPPPPPPGDMGMPPPPPGGDAAPPPPPADMGMPPPPPADMGGMPPPPPAGDMGMPPPPPADMGGMPPPPPPV